MYDGLPTAAQVAGLTATPGATLVIPQFGITAFSYDPLTGDMSVTFESADGAGYNVEASTTLAGWSVVKSAVGTGTSTTLAVTKAELDAALGAAARPKAFLRVVRP